MCDMKVFLERTAISAGQAIMDIRKKVIEVRLKQDMSPVTQADLDAERIITTALALAYPDIPVVGEEMMANNCTPGIHGKRLFLVDALDGTKEFVAGLDDFTVNIALVEDGYPIAGVVYAPARSVLYIGDHIGAEKVNVRSDFTTSEHQKIEARKPPARRVAVTSRSHSSVQTSEYLEDLDISDLIAIGSSLKFCLIAEGVADIYPRFGRTMEWDTAAGDAVLRAAGGNTCSIDNLPIFYGKHGSDRIINYENPYFIASGAQNIVLKNDIV